MGNTERSWVRDTVTKCQVYLHHVYSYLPFPTDGSTVPYIRTAVPPYLYTSIHAYLRTYLHAYQYILYGTYCVVRIVSNAFSASELATARRWREHCVATGTVYNKENLWALELQGQEASGLQDPKGQKNPVVPHVQ